MTPPSPGYVGRFAPSPTGPLHAGSLLAALGSWLHARKHSGCWRVRVEDLDPPREPPGAAEAQLASLARLGLHPDGPVLWQSRRHAAYAEALAQLLAEGHAFRCGCSRADLAATGGIHRRCVAPLPADASAGSVRLRVDDRVIGFHDAVHGRIVQHLGRTVGDVVLRRADGFWAYQLACVVDDAFQGVTDVVRGADLLDSTPRQIALQQALGLPTPRYLHLPLRRDAAGRKLSKSEGAAAIDGQPPLELLRAAWVALGQDPGHWPGGASPEAALAAAVPAFDPARIPPDPAAGAPLPGPGELAGSPPRGCDGGHSLERPDRG
jgi:glutamyl-Q tRNA(Asp) synthetase